MRCHFSNFTFHFPSQFKWPVGVISFPILDPCILSCWYLAKVQGMLGSSQTWGVEGVEVTLMESKGLCDTVDCEFQYFFRLLSHGSCFHEESYVRTEALETPRSIFY